MHSLPICECCPIEKSPYGLCYDGTWEKDAQGVWHFTGTWLCVFYDKENNECLCPNP